MHASLTSTRRLAAALIAGACMSLPPPAAAQFFDSLFTDLPTDPDALAEKVIGDIVSIRGLEFEHDISVGTQTEAEFEQYLREEMDRALPPRRARVFGRIVKQLGLYNGPVIEDAAALMTFLATSQAAAYYNPETSAFYVLIGDTPSNMLAPIYAHELYHGLQDQYWDLTSYMLDGAGNGLDDDELLARQAVVEGEATYVMTLWALRELTGEVPSGFALDLAVRVQSGLTLQALRDLAESSVVPGALGEDVEASLAAMDDIPPFMMETMVGAYLKGMAFVHQVVRQGWDRAANMYTDPPRSSEQILHPEKWLVTRDDPVAITFPDGAHEPALEGWTLLDSNVIGEFQLRIIFDEFGMSDRSTAAAAGWNGDRYAVFERGDELLLLFYTSWDSEAEATEFAAAYEELLGRKYPGAGKTTAVSARGADVLIVEGGGDDEMAGFLQYLGRAGKSD